MRRVLALLLAAAMVAVIAGGVALAQVLHATLLRPGYASDNLLVILAIGSDLGPYHRPGDPLHGRADAIHLLAVDTVAGRATLVDIPRDSWIAGSKVNAYLATGGPERLEGVLEEYTGIPIDFWILTSFRGLELMVEGTDGIEVTVAQPMMDPYSGTSLPQVGTYRINAQQALAFARDRRSVPGGDLGRTHSQGQLLLSAHRELRARAGDLRQITDLIALLRRTTVSNIPAQDLLPLALLAARIDPAAVAQVSLGGGIGNVGAESVVHLAPGDTFDRIRAGQVGP